MSRSRVTLLFAAVVSLGGGLSAQESSRAVRILADATPPAVRVGRRRFPSARDRYVLRDQRMTQLAAGVDRFRGASFREMSVEGRGEHLRLAYTLLLWMNHAIVAIHDEPEQQGLYRRAEALYRSILKANADRKERDPAIDSNAHFWIGLAWVAWHGAMDSVARDRFRRAARTAGGHYRLASEMLLERVPFRPGPGNAALPAALPDPSPQVLVEAYRWLEGVRLADRLRVQAVCDLASLRREIAELENSVRRLEEDVHACRERLNTTREAIRKLMDVDEGPCACGAATHRQCTNKKECDRVEGAQVRAFKNELSEAERECAMLQRKLSEMRNALDDRRMGLARQDAKTERGLTGETDRSWLPEPLRGRVADRVSTTPTLRKYLPAILPYLPEGAIVSSGYRSPAYQFALLKRFARKHGVAWRDDARLDKPETWVEAWRTLLEKKGVVINPPAPARTSEGRRVGFSPHSRGNSFDITGAPAERIVASLKNAEREGAARFLQIKVEPKNGCVHVQVAD